MTMWSGPELDWPREATLPSLVLDAARLEPGRIALIDAGTAREITYGDLAVAMTQMAQHLGSLGFGRGDRLAGLAENSPAYVAAMLAAQALGGAMSGINPMSPPEEIRRQFAKVGAKVILADPPLADAAREAAGSLGIPHVLTTAGQGAPNAAGFEPCAAPEDIALLPFSSGTTGLPKPVILTHRAAISGAVASSAALGAGPDARFLGLAPMFHVVGPLALAMGFVHRAAVVLVPRVEPKLVFDAIERQRVTHAPVLPPILRMMAHHPLGAGRDLSSLVAVGCGGTFLPPAQQTAAAARLGAPVVQVLGLTETMATVAIDRLDDTVPGSVGFPVANVSVRIVDTDTGDRLPAGAPGEIQVRSPALASGFLDLPEETDGLFAADGWLRTGDLGEFDAGGRLWVRGRLKELIKVHAGQVPPAEIELLLLAHPSVADAAVVGRPNAHSGEIPVAYVVWRGQADPFELLEWVNDQLLPYKRLRAIESIDAVPRNPSGKILRRVLAAEDARRRAACVA